MRPTPTLIFDFDGTVCLGSAPVVEYARQLADRVPDDSARRIWDAYDAFAAGHSSEPDGYIAVASALDESVPATVRAEAYVASRAWLRAHPGSVQMPDGAGRFLRELSHSGAAAVLLTNSPIGAVHAVLKHHGLDHAFDRVIGDARKPDRWPDHLATIVGRGGALHAMSVGDVWLNDCAPVLRAGGSAAFIDAHGLRTGPATLVAPTLPQLYDELLAWACEPREFLAAHPLALA